MKSLLLPLSLCAALGGCAYYYPYPYGANAYAYGTQAVPSQPTYVYPPATYPYPYPYAYPAYTPYYGSYWYPTLSISGTYFSGSYRHRHGQYYGGTRRR